MCCDYFRSSSWFGTFQRQGDIRQVSLNQLLAAMNPEYSTKKFQEALVQAEYILGLLRGMHGQPWVDYFERQHTV